MPSASRSVEANVAYGLRARGTPRVANRVFKRVRDYAEVRADGKITGGVAQEALNQLEIDPLGLDEVDRRILRAIVEMFDGGPVGVDTLAAATSEETDTIEDVYEPYLIQLGFLQRTPRGRVATRRGYEHLGIPVKQDMRSSELQPSFFDQNEDRHS
jgi:Holliday junction DNA helicase RuvB